MRAVQIDRAGREHLYLIRWRVPGRARHLSPCEQKSRVARVMARDAAARRGCSAYIGAAVGRSCNKVHHASICLPASDGGCTPGFLRVRARRALALSTPRSNWNENNLPPACRPGVDEGHEAGWPRG